MKKRQLQRVVGHVVLAAMPTLALTTACRTTGEATYVVRSNGRTCQVACASLSGNGDEGSWRVAGVMDCVEATEMVEAAPPLTSGSASETDETVESAASPAGQVATPVAVCRMQTRYMGGIGRRPDGLVVCDAEGASEAGAFFARMEQLERAAVVAFARAAIELRARDAPPHLVRDVIRARREEETHVVIAARWRAHFGGVLGAIHVPSEGARSLEDLARENAAEGCVHETWGAVLALAHARRAASDEALDAMSRDLHVIAADEASHAALSHRLDAWMRTSLSPRARRALDHARRDAIEEVRASLDEDHDRLAVIGWPSRLARVRLFDVVSDRLGWRTSARTSIVRSAA